MNLAFKQVNVGLESSAVVTLDDSLDAKIVCEEGTLWITQDGDPRDVVLTRGQSYFIDRTSRVVIFAVSKSAVTLSSRPCTPIEQAPAKDSFIERWFARPARSLAAPLPSRL